MFFFIFDIYFYISEIFIVFASYFYSLHIYIYIHSVEIFSLQFNVKRLRTYRNRHYINLLFLLFIKKFALLRSWGA